PGGSSCQLRDRAAGWRQGVEGDGDPRVQGARDRQAARAARGPPAGAPGAAEERAKAEGAARAARVSPILALVGGHDGPLRCARWGRWWLPGHRLRPQLVRAVTLDKLA